MPKLEYYSDVKVIKKPVKKRIKSIFKIFIFFLILGVSFLGAKYLSKAITVGNLGALIVYGDTKIKTSETNMYAVTMGEYLEKNEAEKVALGVSVQGAGGFVWEKDNKYYVVGNVYSNKEDAQKVSENLVETKYNINILEINFPKLNLDFSMYENEDMSVINDAVNIFDDVYELIYDYSIKFDKKEISHLAVSSGISNIRGEVKGIIVNVQNLINKSSSKLKHIQNSLVKIDEVLDQAIIKTIDNTSTSYSLKYSITNVVKIKHDLFNLL